jgi:hypothetical protein
MKRAFISKMAVRFYEYAGILACFSLAGCDYLNNGDTCNRKWEEEVTWTAKTGISDFYPSKLEEVSSWSPTLTSGDKFYHFTNVCPNSIFYLRVRVLEMSDLSAFKKLKYRAVVSFNFGTHFEGFNSYDLVRKGPTLIETDIATIPDMLSYLDGPTIVNVAVFVEVPYEGNETEAKAVTWAQVNINEIYLDANFTLYK